MQSKTLIGFLIAGTLAIIAALVYWFFFRKQKSNDVMNLDNIPPVATNPISSQDSTNSIPDYVPVNPDVLTGGEFGSQSDNTSSSDSGSAFIKGFTSTPQETLTSGEALTQRTNNPGALFWDGSTNWQGMNKSKTKSGQIIYFDSVDYGVRAQLMTLKNYAKNHGIITLIGITTRYAPKGHGNNDPAVYAQTLAGCLGMQVFDAFRMDSNRNLLAAIGYYIHRIEAGYYWVTREKYLEWSTKV